MSEKVVRGYAWPSELTAEKFEVSRERPDVLRPYVSVPVVVCPAEKWEGLISREAVREAINAEFDKLAGHVVPYLKIRRSLLASLGMEEEDGDKDRCRARYPNRSVMRRCIKPAGHDGLHRMRGSGGAFDVFDEDIREEGNWLPATKEGETI